MTSGDKEEAPLPAYGAGSPKKNIPTPDKKQRLDPLVLPRPS